MINPLLRRRVDGAYPITIKQLFGIHPEIQTMVDPFSPAVFGSKGFDIVHETQVPKPTELDKVVEGQPVYNHELSRWEQVWRVEDISSTLDQGQVARIIAESKVAALSKLAEKSRDVQRGGTTWEGNFIPTDDQTCFDVLWAMQSFQIDPEQKINWPTPVGGWITVDSKFMTALFRIMTGHKQKCLAVERDAFAKINKLRHPTDMELLINSLTWPQ